VLENPADDHSQGPFALKGTSDKFLLKFRKPRK
jgi:predicted methyltransferase